MRERAAARISKALASEKDRSGPDLIGLTTIPK